MRNYKFEKCLEPMIKPTEIPKEHNHQALFNVQEQTTDTLQLDSAINFNIVSGTYTSLSNKTFMFMVSYM